MTDISGWLKAIQLPPRFLAGFAIIGGSLLAMPQKWAEWLHVTAATSQYRWIVTTVTGVAAVFWLVQMIPTAASQVQLWRLRRHSLTRMDTLGVMERAVLAYCLIKNVRTVVLYEHHAVAQSLVGKGLLVFSGTRAANARSYPFGVPDHVWRYIQDNPKSILSDWNPSNPEFVQQVVAAYRQVEDMPWWGTVR